MNDESYKRLLYHRRTVKDLLLGFIARLRPAGWADSLIFDSLREGPAEYVTDDLRRRLSDVVWTIDRRAADGSVRTIQVLIEHQSSVDHSMPLRFLNYGSLMYQRSTGTAGGARATPRIRCCTSCCTTARPAGTRRSRWRGWCRRVRNTTAPRISR